MKLVESLRVNLNLQNIRFLPSVLITNLIKFNFTLVFNPCT